MKTFIAVIVLCFVSANAYLPVGPNMALNATSVNPQVVGGEKAKIDQAPWIISLVLCDDDKHFCGGSLVGEKAVLTAAHCCDGETPKSVKVKYGGTDRTKLQNTNQVTQIIMHPNYSSSTLDNDYCVLCLADPVETSDHVKIISIPSSRPKSGTKAELTGWGKTSGTSTMPKKLQCAEMSILSSSECNEKWSDVNPVTKNMICAESKTASGCNGDSGGPLVVKNEHGECELAGAVSWGASGCPFDTTVYPTVYSDVFTRKKWIAKKIKQCSNPSKSPS